MDELTRKIKEVIKEEMKSGLFTARKVTDMPTDNLAVTNRKYVNLNGTVANRPNSSIASIGQHYFPTDTRIPLVFDGTNWRDGVGSVAATN